MIAFEEPRTVRKVSSTKSYGHELMVPAYYSINVLLVI